MEQLQLYRGDCLEVACVNTDRNFIGMELDPQYFEIAKERITTAASKWLDGLLGGDL